MKGMKKVSAFWRCPEGTVNICPHCGKRTECTGLHVRRKHSHSACCYECAVRHDQHMTEAKRKYLLDEINRYREKRHEATHC